MASKAQRMRDQKAARLFKLVASTTRVAILSTLLSRGPLAVREIAEALDMTHSAVSHQLGVLSAAQMVASSRDGRSVIYEIANNARAKALVKFLGTVR